MADLADWLDGAKSLGDLEDELVDWGQRESYWTHRGAFKTWYASEGRIMPFGGGYYDQPAGLMHLFGTLSKVVEWLKIDAPPADEAAINIDGKDGKPPVI